MAYTGVIPSVTQFRTRFPQFTEVNYPDEVVQDVIGEAALQVDDSWDPAAAVLGIQYLTAHILYSERMTGVGTGGILTSERVGPASYTYDVKPVLMIPAMGNLGLSVYGQRWLLLLKQQRAGPLLV